ncbi:hypothetical protein LTR46_002839 [Exophiala xenobiotica]|nr:hypothetical protein LTR46_002839 [Exophiala xenobiotica]
MNVAEDDALEHDAKRRKLRKGTRSCWECKHRKVRCTFASATDATCITCRRRGARCLGQELPEEVGRIEDGAGRISRVEALLENLVKKIDHNVAKDRRQSTSGERRTYDPAVLTPAPSSKTASTVSLHESSLEGHHERVHDTSRYSLSATSHTPGSLSPRAVTPTPSAASKYNKITRGLIASFPTQNDINILFTTRSKTTTKWCHDNNVRVHNGSDWETLQEVAKLGETNGPLAHPTLLAISMLTISSSLMHLPPQQDIPGLSEHHRIIMERMADAAIKLVTTNEELLGTIESLECIVHEGLYHLNGGHIRRGWLAFRRAMMAAQLMCISHPRGPPVKSLEPDTSWDPPSMWSRIVYMDRFLSLMLGLPPGHNDVKLDHNTDLASGPCDDRIESIHAAIAGKILERNRLSPSQSALDLTLEIDTELRMTAESLTPDFWKPPDMTRLEKGPQEAFSETMRIRDQVTHYTLLNQLHLPFLLCPNSGMADSARTSCVYASREILTRFNTFRAVTSMQVCCRLADFIALVAGMTLMLAHIDSHRHKKTDNLLAHQRLGDRATVNQALGNMELHSKRTEDMLAARCAVLLQHLLRIEADASQAQKVSLDNTRRHEGHHDDEPKALFITVPYFGGVRIARDGIKFVGTIRTSAPHPQDLEAEITIGGIGSVHDIDRVEAKDFVQPSTEVPACASDRVNLPPVLPFATQSLPEDMHHGTISESAPVSDAFMADDFMMQQDLYPGVAAGANDWVFQGVDTAFFDSLIMQEGVQLGDGFGASD